MSDILRSLISTDRPPRLRLGILLFTGGLLITATLLVTRWAGSAPMPEPASYSQLLAAIDDGSVTAITVEPGRRILGYRSPQAQARGEALFVTAFPLESDPRLMERAEAAGVQVALMGPAAWERWAKLGGVALNLAILAILAAVVIPHLRTGMAVGTTPTVGDGSTTFEDVAGAEGAVAELREAVEFLRDPESFLAVGARPPKGVLLSGPPGTGKTLMARAVAGEASVPFYSISGSEVTGFLIGLGASRVRSLFRKARKSGGVIFIDEIDALGGRRGQNQSHNEDDRTLNQLLIEMDGFSPTSGVVVIGATNRPDVLDPALLRAGRFDRQIAVGNPTASERSDILRLHVARQGIPLDPDVDLARLARLLPGSSGADLANLLNEAAIAAGRERAERVCWRHIELARDRVLLGKERSSFRAREQEWEMVAAHEAGHALAGVVCCPDDGLHKVTIQPRGRAMGVAHFSPADDLVLHSRDYLEGQIAKLMAGRVAEEILYGPGRTTSGAESDLVQANRIARAMVTRFGMGRTGYLVEDDASGPLSAEARGAMEQEIRRILDEGFARAREVLEANRDALVALAASLREHETLTGEAALELLAGHGLAAASDRLAMDRRNAEKGAGPGGPAPLAAPTVRPLR